MSTNTTAGAAASTTQTILEGAGFQMIRGGRAICPYCGPEHARTNRTVAIHGELFFCHRCKVGGHVRSLAMQRGMTLPPPRVRKANIPKHQFRTWLSERMTELADEERLAYKK